MITESHLDDLVARLRNYVETWYDGGAFATTSRAPKLAADISESADAIVALRARAEQWEKVANDTAQADQKEYDAEVDRLSAEVVALRDALRNRGAVKIPGPGDWGWCHICNAGNWKHGEPERHAIGCLANKDNGK